MTLRSRHFVLALTAMNFLGGLHAGALAQDAQTPSTGTLASDQYRLGPGDVLSIFVWRNADLSVTVPVRPDGRITTPLVEDLEVAGKTPVEVARAIEVVLAEYVKNPQVNVIVASAASVLNQVKVVGQVRKAKPVPYVEGMTVLDVILATDGLGEFAAGNRAKILRKEEGKERQIHVKLKDIQEGDLRTNVAMKPGDVLVVPESMF